MSDDDSALKAPFIVWIDYGCEGWKPRGCDTLGAAHEYVASGLSFRVKITGPVIWPEVETPNA